MRSMSRYEVLDARMAPGLATASSWRNTASFTPISSNTASTMRSASFSAAYSSVGVIRPMRCSTCSGLSLPFFMEFS